MAEWLKALAVPLEDLGSFLGTHMARIITSSLTGFKVNSTEEI